MNVFILSTGRCGSTTFQKACDHITNFTFGHETRCSLLGDDRLDYPADHIESDNRLAWFLGRLDRRFGKDAHYVHLYRDPDPVARSYAKRYARGLLFGYREGITLGLRKDCDHEALAADMVDTITANIRLFLRDKPHQMDFRIESGKEDFDKFWDWIGAAGDKAAALGEFDVMHNHTGVKHVRPRKAVTPGRVLRKAQRIVTGLPEHIRRS